MYIISYNVIENIYLNLPSRSGSSVMFKISTTAKRETPDEEKSPLSCSCLKSRILTCYHSYRICLFTWHTRPMGGGLVAASGAPRGLCHQRGASCMRLVPCSQRIPSAVKGLAINYREVAIKLFQKCAPPPVFSMINTFSAPLSCRDETWLAPHLQFCSLPPPHE